MATDFKFPDLGEGVTEGEIKKWLVKEGDTVKQDQSIAEVETDKAVVEMPSPSAGKVLRLYHKEGDMVQVGEVLATIGAEGEAPSVTPAQAAPAIEKKRESVSVVGELPEGEVMVSSTGAITQATAGAEVQAIPAVRKLAKDLGVDITTVLGSGPGGRITEEDVRGAAFNAKPAAPRKVAKFDIYGYVDREPLRGIRRTTAKHMLESSQKVAAVTMMDDADVTELVALRERLKKEAEEQHKVKLTFLPFIVKALCMALKNHKYLNASIDEESDEILVKKYYNVGIAIAIDDGLVVPVIKMADEKEFLAIAEEIRDLVEKAQARKLDLADLKGGTFTITNYGSMGGTYGTPIVNFPECAILGLGRIRDMPWMHDGQVQVRKILPLSLTWDHRVLDGAAAAAFMGELMKYLENPEFIMALH
ncbi:MAG TPA: dihydrolipoamide acetyltransferase family protein [Methanomassiliicoccales archaeon]|nr:dihydrolipoamide acetyltransferase family protein [Methanomassiliicoccales archaeon]